MGKTISGWRLIISYLGVFAIIIGIFLLVPLASLIFFPNESQYAWCFVVPGLISIALGYITAMCFRGMEKDRLKNHEDAVLVCAFWLMAILICALPFLLSRKYDFVQSLFEATSGLTTTGLSVVDVASCPHIFLLFRSLLLFAGGVGLVLILTCAISDKYNLKLYMAEGHQDKLLPNLVKSARLILSIYSIYILLGTIAYICSGMSPFDSICTSIASVSTGGFSNNPNSIGGYHSLPIEIITIVLMCLGSTNFVIHLYLIRGQFRKIWRHSEIRFFVFATLLVIPIMVLICFFDAHMSLGDSFRVSAFQFFSSITTTGFQNVPSVAALPSSMKTIMIVLMLIGGGVGSTAGGIKQYRVVSVVKGSFVSIAHRSQNYKIVKHEFIYQNGREIIFTKDDFISSASFMAAYLLLFFTGSFIFTLFGYSLSDSMFEFASSIGTVGLSVGITGFSAHPVILLTSICGMILGRLEIVVVFNALGKVIRPFGRS
jgi:trk system potassium uptake protein TrkH